MSEQQSARARRKTRVGTVVKDAMRKSVVVSLARPVTHALYGKQAQRTKKVVAHDEADTAKVGDVVRIMETRPLSRTKRWRVVGIVQRAE
jgi:small subunit ribosomal protein S17